MEIRRNREKKIQNTKNWKHRKRKLLILGKP
jgi:hypothetical protein